VRKRSGSHCTGGWMVTRTGLDRCSKSGSPPGFYPRPPTLCRPTSQSHHLCEINRIWVWLLA